MLTEYLWSPWLTMAGDATPPDEQKGSGRRWFRLDSPGAYKVRVEAPYVSNATLYLYTAAGAEGPLEQLASFTSRVVDTETYLVSTEPNLGGTPDAPGEQYLVWAVEGTGTWKACFRLSVVGPDGRSRVPGLRSGPTDSRSDRSAAMARLNELADWVSVRGGYTGGPDIAQVERCWRKTDARGADGGAGRGPADEQCDLAHRDRHGAAGALDHRFDGRCGLCLHRAERRAHARVWRRVQRAPQPRSVACRGPDGRCRRLRVVLPCRLRREVDGGSGDNRRPAWLARHAGWAGAHAALARPAGTRRRASGGVE